MHTTLEQKARHLDVRISTSMYSVGVSSRRIGNDEQFDRKTIKRLHNRLIILVMVM
jgi:hypothetical protein